MRFKCTSYVTDENTDLLVLLLWRIQLFLFMVYTGAAVTVSVPSFFCLLLPLFFSLYVNFSIEG